ncbi:MAG: hypothetical protein SGPRY_014428 [Prymnesium sp.]
MTEAINCKMKKDMKGDAIPLALQNPAAGGKLALFSQQMIGHHENAVNMAKTVIKFATPESITNALDEDGMWDILYGIINTQNFQVLNLRD